MSLRKVLSRPLKKLGRLFRRGKRKSGRTGTDIAGEGSGAISTDSPPQPESSVVANPVYGKGGSEADGGEGEIGPMGSPPQPNDPEATSADERDREPGRGRVGVDEGEVGLMDLSPQSGSGVVLGSRHSHSNETVVDGEVDLVDMPPRLYHGISGDQEPSGGMWRMLLKSLLGP